MPVEVVAIYHHYLRLGLANAKTCGIYMRDDNQGVG
jgi:hypothetical protein